jgi:hypothetical protein
VLTFRAWCANLQRAQMLVSICHDALRCRGLILKRGAVSAPVDEVIATLARAAEDLGMALHSDTEIQATAEAVVRHVEATLEQMLRGGQLRDLNRRYSR